MNLLKRVKITRVLDSQVAGTTDTLSSSILDMAGFDGVLFLLLLGDVTTNAVLTFQAQQNTANSGTGMATLAGTAAQSAAGASNQDNQVLALDVVKPTERYLRAQLVRATANAVVDGIIAIQYQGRLGPVTQSADVLSEVVLASPAEA